MAVVDDFARTARRECDDRQATLHCLAQAESEVLFERRVDEGVAAVENGLLTTLIEASLNFDSVVQIKRADEFFELFEMISVSYSSDNC